VDKVNLGRQMAVVEVDQSIKMGDLSGDTVLACSDHWSCTILVPAYVKRVLMKSLRARGKSRIRATLQLFAIGLFLLLKDTIARSSLVIIDTEYTGYESDIRGMLLNYLRRVESEFDKERIVFRQVGKKSSAHHLAISVHRGKSRPDKVLSIDDFLSVLGQK